MSSRFGTAKRFKLKNSDKKATKMKETECRRVVREFCKDTTLHGFKYLTSKNYYDRVGWLICCCASACCAAVLCSVLWARFQQVPALLTQLDLRGELSTARMPTVAVCPSAESVAYYFQKNLSINEKTRQRLPIILSYIKQRKTKVTTKQLTYLQDILMENNLTLRQALIRFMPTCDNIVKNCRWQINTIPCKNLFRKEVTEWGACCISRPHNLASETMASQLEVTKKLSIAVQCSGQLALGGCEFFTKYFGEEWIKPMLLNPGYSYFADISFASFIDRDPDKLIDGTCVNTNGYSRTKCLLNCKENHCGCTEPLRNKVPDKKGLLPCSLTQLGCLRTFDFENFSCNCLPPCKKIFTYMSLESSPMNALEHTHDEVYYNVNASISSVLHITVRISESRLFVVNPTETWITLLSSLGGVFNMFLGIGLFSALEVLYLIFLRLPIAIRKSTDMAESSYN